MLRDRDGTKLKDAGRGTGRDDKRRDSMKRDGTEVRDTGYGTGRDEFMVVPRSSGLHCPGLGDQY